MNDTPNQILSMRLSSPAFSEGEPIPIKYSGQGEGISPPLAWGGAPAGVNSYALIVDDPDASLVTFVHWVVFNLPPTLSGLPENIDPDRILPGGARQGKNTLKKSGYTPPMPPTKKQHRYYFKLYALDTRLDLDSASSKADVLKAIDGHVLAEGRLMGTYQRH